MFYLKALLLILSIILVLVEINLGLSGFDLARFYDLAELVIGVISDMRSNN